MTTATTVQPRHVRSGPAGSRSRSFFSGLSAAATVVVVIVAVLLVVVAVASRVSPRGKFVVLGHPTFVVLSGSMTPAILAGDLVIDDPVTPAQASRLQPGRVITFHTSTGLVLTHRIVAVVAGPDSAVAYRTKGDANNAADLESVAPDQIQGVVQGRVRAAGYVFNALHRPMTLALLLAAPLLWLLSGALLRRSRREPGPDQGGVGSAQDPAASADASTGGVHRATVTSPSATSTTRH